MTGLVDWVLGRRRGAESMLGERPDSVEALEARYPEAFAEQHNACAIALFRELLLGQGNVFFSPWSVRTALAMVYAGSREETAREMARALGFGPNGEAFHSVFRQAIERLHEHEGNDYQLVSANSMWGQQGHPLREEFLQLIENSFAGGLRHVDFGAQADAAAAAINGWVAGQTRERIKRLVAPGDFTGDTALVLTNAIYFKGQWRQPFEPLLTSVEPFYLEDGDTVEVPTMRFFPFGGSGRFFRGQGFEVAELDYRAGELSMLVLLPKSRIGLRSLERELASGLLERCVRGLKDANLRIELPRFHFSWGTRELKDALIEMGVRRAFDPERADLSGIDGVPPTDPTSLFISKVLHKAQVEINEEGTVAAGATAVEAKIGGVPESHEFIVDHPFLFLIRERTSGLVLFAGRVEDPTQV